jgi:hypothetical protein
MDPMKSAADIIDLIERRSEEYRRATAEVAACGLAYIEAPHHTPTWEAFRLAELAQVDARARLMVQCESLSFVADPLVAAAYLDAALRSAELAHQLAQADARRTAVTEAA